MWQTLFVIPSSIAGVSVFGVGWLLALWAVVAAVLLARSYRAHGLGPQTTGQLPLLIVAALTIVFVLPSLVDPTLGGVPIRGYGVMLLVSVLAGIALSVYRVRKLGIDPEIILSLATWFFISGIVGARLFYVVEYWENFQKPSVVDTLLAIINLTQGGLVVYGSMLAGGAALIVFIRKHHLPGLALADLIAPGVVLGVGLGRIGCFLNGCCYGGICDLPWAISFPAGSPAYIDQAERGQLYVHGLVFRGTGVAPPIVGNVEPGSPAEQAGMKSGQEVVAINGHRVDTIDEAHRVLFATFGAGKQIAVSLAGDSQPKAWTIAATPPTSRPVHPAQLYSLFDALLLCAFLLAFEPYKRRDGELTALVLTIHPISRFLLEIIRADEGAVAGIGLKMAQTISIAIFIGGLLLWAYLLTRRPQSIPWPSDWARKPAQV